VTLGVGVLAVYITLLPDTNAGVDSVRDRVGVLGVAGVAGVATPAGVACASFAAAARAAASRILVLTSTECARRALTIIRW
jgi:hypothetical protein